MQKHAAFTPMPIDVSDAPAYPAELTSALQAELAALAAIDAVYDEKRHRLENWPGPKEMKDQLAREVEVCHKRDREPHVLRLGELHERIMALTMFRNLRPVH
jgi:hypothetical protein